MSVTGHRDVRLADDFYETPAWCTRLLMPHLQRGNVLDPCCGRGAIGQVVFETWGPNYELDGVEIDEGRAQAAREAGFFDRVATGDFLHPEGKIFSKGQLVITNPPFSLALEFAEKSVKVADTVAFLLRLGWLASAERADFHRRNPCDLIILPKRPSFAKFASCAGHKKRPSMPPPCDWNQAYLPNEPHPKVCPGCGCPTKVVTSDSADYAWFIWGPGRGGRIVHPTQEQISAAIDIKQQDERFAGAAAELEELTR